MEVEGPTLAQWYRIAGVGLPNTPPYSTRGHVVLKDGVWKYDDFSGKVGKSDLAGSVSYQRAPSGRASWRTWCPSG